VGDLAQRLAGTEPDEDLFAFKDAEAAKTGLPFVGDPGREPTGADHEPDHRRGAADLACDVDESPTACSESEGELLLFVGEDARHGAAPVVDELGSSQDQCAHRLDPPIRKAIGAFDRSSDLHELYDPAGKRVLDYGCGEGRFSFHLLENGAASVTGFDISSKRISAATSRAA
jgi:hypothetical protein